MYLLAIYFIYSTIALASGYYHAIKKQNPFGLTPWLFFIGSFVWGDALLLGLFWSIVSAMCVVFNQVHLFVFTYSVFWIIRSFGEVQYWMHQQFTSVIRDQPETLWLHRFVRSSAVWFMYQVFWQCFAVISIVSSVFFGWVWINSL